jgi:hypothetical protein
MNYNDALNIYSSIKGTSLIKLKSDLIKSAVRYSRLRVEWRLIDLERRKNLSQERTSAHNAFIDSCNILGREMAKIGENNRWRVLLGSERETIGDFACYLNCILGIEAG